MLRFHLETLKDMKNIELVAILTTANGTENRKKLKNKYKIKNDYENIDEMLSHSLETNCIISTSLSYLNLFFCCIIKCKLFDRKTPCS